MKHRQISIADIKGVWRIIAAIMLCQIIGSIIGLVVAPHYYWFMNFWIGGAVGSLPGFTMGIVWQLRSVAASERDWIGAAGLLGFIAIAITGMALGSVLPQMRCEMKNLNVVRQLPSERLQSIEVFDEYQHERIVGITDCDSLKAFVKGISDAVGHSPNHPRYSDSWHVIVKGTTTHEFKLHINPRYPQSVIGDIIVKSGNRSLYQGTFKSKGLRSWVEAHLMKENTGFSI